MLRIGNVDRFAAVILVGCVIGLAAAFGCAGSEADAQLDALYEKQVITIVVTDSGLGGLSVAAALERGLREERIFAEVDLIFANALASRDHPYNLMESKAEKLRVFDSALAGMYRAFEPDIMLIGCNTLSVIYAETEFSQTATIPVLDIVPFGVDLIADGLAGDSSGSAIVLGTPTTVDQGTHVSELMELGFAGSRVASQACEMLESEIQADPHSDIVRAMIDMYAYEALEKQDSLIEGDLTVGLCCTHYGFALETFESVFATLTDRRVTVVDPNQRMADFIVRSDKAKSYDSTVVRIEVVSQAEISPEEIGAIGKIIRRVSSPTADAIADYQLREDLFSF